MPNSTTCESSYKSVPLMRLAFMGLTASLLASCQTTGTLARDPVVRDIPDPPGYLQSLPNPPATEGSSPFVIAAERAAVIERQNTIIAEARRNWLTMKRVYSRNPNRHLPFGR